MRFGALRLAAVLLPRATRTLATTPARYTSVESSYTPLRRHPSLFEPSHIRECIDPAALDLLYKCELLAASTDVLEGDEADIASLDQLEKGCHGVLVEEVQQVYSFPLLTEVCIALTYNYFITSGRNITECLHDSEHGPGIAG